LLLAVTIPACRSGNELPSLKETFSKTDKDPFGTYVAFNQLNQLFYFNDIRVKKTAFEKSLDENNDTSSVYINISSKLFLSAKDLEQSLAFVEKGNSMFISSNYFDTSLLKAIHFPFKQSFDIFGSMLNRLKNTAVELQPFYYADSSLYSYFYLPFENSFAVHDNAEIKTLGTNEKHEPNFVVVFYGKGRFYLHCEPRAFSNYFLLQKNNYKYLQYVFSFMPSVPEHVFWDDFYSKRNIPPSAEDDGEKSGFSVLLKYPAMAWAFWLTLLLLLLYILFGSKRRQRIIKPIPANENTSVAFTETVSRLYLQKKDNRNIADKMITYFFEHIRNQYFLNTSQVNEEFISTLSRKSNVPKEETEKLFSTISKVQQSAETSDQQLLLLNHQVENFYKHKL
jgi:hypothetical protein